MAFFQLGDSVGVVGAGQMGQGIAQVLAQAGFNVSWFDVQPNAAAKGKESIARQLTKLIEKQKMNAGEDAVILKKLNVANSLEEFSRTRFVIEAIRENIDDKIKLFQNLDKICNSEVVFASNTSSISITTLAASTSRPDRFIGMHFMNPVPVMKLIEGICGVQTSKDTKGRMTELSNLLSKELVFVRDIPGFAVNRILMPMINEAIQTIYEGIASIEGIDTAMQLGTNQPMGPLTLADFIGLDTCLAIMETLYEGLGDSKYRPSPLLKQLVAAGWYGRKSKQGFYIYGGEKPVASQLGIFH